MVLKWFKGTGFKKYKVEIHEKGKKNKTVQFGDRRYGQFKDKTPLKLYSKKDTNDRQQRDRYRKRHNYAKPKYSAGWFAEKYLW